MIQSVSLNTKFTFDSFVVDPSNELAFRAAKAIAARSGLYTPAIFYGSTGLGKTHLLQAIGNALQCSTSRRIYYNTAQQWIDDYVMSARHGTSALFRDVFAEYDVVIVDDLDVFSSRPETEAEFLNICKELWEVGKQIILSALPHMTRIFKFVAEHSPAGIMTELLPLDNQAKRNLLLEKIGQQDIELSDDLMNYIVDNTGNSIVQINAMIKNVAFRLNRRHTITL